MKLDFYKMYGCLSWFNYIWWLLKFNLLIVVSNLPLVLLAMIAPAVPGTLPAFFLAGLTIGPSLTAAFEAISHIEDHLSRYYLQTLKAEWKKALKVWVPMWTAISLIAANLMLMESLQVTSFMKWVFFALFCLLCTFLCTFLIVWTQWKQQPKDAAVLTLKLALVKPVQYNLNFLILLGTIVILSMNPVYLFLYGASIGVFLMYKNFQPVIRFVEERPENRKEIEHV